MLVACLAILSKCLVDSLDIIDESIPFSQFRGVLNSCMNSCMILSLNFSSISAALSLLMTVISVMIYMILFSTEWSCCTSKNLSLTLILNSGNLLYVDIRDLNRVNEFSGVKPAELWISTSNCLLMNRTVVFSQISIPTGST